MQSVKRQTQSDSGAQFAGDEGRGIAHDERATGELAQRWFARIAGETEATAHYSVAITSDGATHDWLAIAAPQTVAAQRVAMFPEPRLSPSSLAAISAGATTLGRRARVRGKGRS